MVAGIRHDFNRWKDNWVRRLVALFFLPRGLKSPCVPGLIASPSNPQINIFYDIPFGIYQGGFQVVLILYLVIFQRRTSSVASHPVDQNTGMRRRVLAKTARERSPGVSLGRGHSLPLPQEPGKAAGDPQRISWQLGSHMLWLATSLAAACTAEATGMLLT